MSLQHFRHVTIGRGLTAEEGKCNIGSIDPIPLSVSRLRALATLSRSAVRASDLKSTLDEAEAMTRAVRAVEAEQPLSDEDREFLQAVEDIVSLAVTRHERPRTEAPSQELLRMVFDHAPLMISFWDSSNRLIYVNGEWERTLGWTLEEVKKFDFVTTFYPDPISQEEVMAFIRRSDGAWCDFRPMTRDGRRLDSSWIRLRLSNGTSVGFGVDISRRKETERALAESEARFAKLFQISPVALAISTLETGRIVDVNETWLEMFGYSREEVIGRSNAELRLAVDASTRAGIIQKIHADGRIRNLETQVRTKSGEIRNVIVSAVPVTPSSGGEESWLSAQVDITDRMIAQAERDQLLETANAARAAAEMTLDRLNAIESITDSALQNLGLDELLQELLARVRGALNAEMAAVALVDERRQDLYIRAVAGRAHPQIMTIRCPIGQGMSGMTAADGVPRIVHDLATIDLSHVTGATPSEILERSRAAMVAPLRVGGRIIGVVTAASLEPHYFNDDDLKLMLLVGDRVAPIIERARLTETVDMARERLRALSSRLLTAQEEERRRLAVELHDELGQVLTVVKINLRSFERRLDAQSRSDLAETIATIDEAMERVRNLALDLRPALLDDLGLPAALRWYAARFARDTSIEVDVSTESVPRLAPALETAYFRVMQEALTNVARHARARHVWIELQSGDDPQLIIRDDGAGFDVLAARERAAGGLSLGLLGMEERVTSLGGRFEVQSAPGAGTQVSAHFPAIAVRGGS